METETVYLMCGICISICIVCFYLTIRKDSNNNTLDNNLN